MTETHIVEAVVSCVVGGFAIAVYQLLERIAKYLELIHDAIKARTRNQ